MNFTRARGFSLLELVIVICIVAMLIYAALPHFETALKQAHETSVQLNARALQEGILRAKALAILQNINGETYNLPRFGDGTLDLSPAGYPAGTNRKPGDQLIAQHCVEIWHALLDSNLTDNNSPVNDAYALGNFRAAVEKTGRNPVCSYIYQHGGMRIVYDPSTGSVAADAKFKGFAFSG